ncbi:MFS transporter [Tumebacillus sp. DT12]|uniref:MFS transporter n=1 Tax=Tumebacillus lacus TaxID=2995335 RepID=A0ABT3X5I0_9BACL|nr:MFS transporter [Tumebacillus lacus]MCX7572163.1 MFS transporter [Tumebacillus lacus]
MANKKSLPILMLVMFLVMVGFGIIIPVMPFFAEEVGASPMQLGLLMASYSVMQFLFAPMWGRISDRIGRKPVMLIGIAGLSLSFFLFAFSDTLTMMFVSRILAGFLSSANMPTVMAYVADITTPENRGKGMGMIGASVGMGFIFGPAIGGIFSRESYSTPFLIAGVVAAITFVFVLLVVKESLAKENRKTKGEANESRWKAFGGSLSYLYMLSLITTFSLAALEATFAYFAAERAGLDTVHLGYIFMIMGVAGAFVQGGMVGRLIKKFGEGGTLQIGLIVSAIGFGLVLLTNSFWTAALYLSVFGMGNSLIRPCVSAIISKRTTVGQGAATGLLSSFESLGRVAGPPIGGAIYAVQMSSPYLTGLVATVVALVLYRMYVSKVPGKAV